MAIVSNEKLTEAFSLALEDRSRGYADLVSNSNVITAVMKKKGGFSTFSGPSIRERLLYNESGTYVRYSGHEFLNPKPAELFNDAEYTAKMAAVAVTMSFEDILKNSGGAQLMDIMEAHMDAAEQELQDRFAEDLHSDGTATNQIGGLQAAVPTVATSGVYGGIDRAVEAKWRTGSYTATGLVGGVLSDTNIHDAFSQVLINHTRGKNGPSLIAVDSGIYRKFQKSLINIQRITKEGSTGTLGFPSLAYAGVGYELDVVLEGGIGSAMPANTAYFLKVGKDGINFRYHPDRNFSAFGGKRQPINQDAVVQYVGFMGNLTMANPLHQAKLRDV
jgi:hypothetical protein